MTDKDTIVFTSAEDYAGAASVSFEVTDGAGPDDAEGLTAVLTLPIDVTPAKNQPPKITGTPVLEVAAGEDGLGRPVAVRQGPGQGPADVRGRGQGRHRDGRSPARR